MGLAVSVLVLVDSSGRTGLGFATGRGPSHSVGQRLRLAVTHQAACNRGGQPVFWVPTGTDIQRLRRLLQVAVCIVDACRR
ncbi:MAG: hypothetical protein ACI855_001409 [Myxococcota bacterium]|jgi:hypothetical protein